MGCLTYPSAKFAHKDIFVKKELLHLPDVLLVSTSRARRFLSLSTQSGVAIFQVASSVGTQCNDSIAAFIQSWSF